MSGVLILTLVSIAPSSLLSQRYGVGLHLGLRLGLGLELGFGSRVESIKSVKCRKLMKSNCNMSKCCTSIY